jgi:hypothetical protein
MPVIGFLNSPPMAIRPWRPHSSRAGLTEKRGGAPYQFRHAGLGRPVQVILPQATAPWALHRSLGAGRSPTSGARGRRAGAGARRALRPGGCPAHSLCADSARCRAAPAGADQPSHCDGWLVDATLKRRSLDSRARTRASRARPARYQSLASRRDLNFIGSMSGPVIPTDLNDRYQSLAFRHDLNFIGSMSGRVIQIRSNPPHVGTEYLDSRARSRAHITRARSISCASGKEKAPHLL